MQTIKLSADTRTATGKCAVRRLRGTDKIPAVAYGKGLATKQIAVSPKDVAGVLATERGRNSVIELDIAGSEKLTVLLTDYQYHPVTRALLHADFKQIDENQPIDVDVPFEALGKAKGVVDGGILRVVYRKLPVRCLPIKVPAKLTHDVTALEIDDSVLAKELTLPEGVTVRLAPDQTVIAVGTVKKQVEEEAAAAVPGAPGAAGAAAAAGAAGAAGAAPAAGAAAAPGAAGAKGAAPAAGAKPAGKPSK